MSAYATDLAYIHDIAYGDYSRNAAPWLLRRFRAAGIGEGLVVDLGCGSGHWAAELLGAGYEVVGIDISPAMIARARRRAPEARFRTGSVLDSKLPPCAAVTALGEVLSYSFDPKNSEPRIEQLMRRVHRALRPGGLFIFDIAEPGIAPDGAERRRFAAGDWAILLEVREDARRHTAARDMIIFRRIGRAYRRTREIHPMRLFRRERIVQLLGRCGFSVEVVEAYGKTRFAPAHAGFVARKSPETKRQKP